MAAARNLLPSPASHPWAPLHHRMGLLLAWAALACEGRCSRVELGLDGGRLRVCGGGASGLLDQALPQLSLVRLLALGKGCLGSVVSSKLLVTRVLGAQLSSSSVARVCPGSCADGTGCVCGLWGTGSSVAIQGLLGTGCPQRLWFSWPLKGALLRGSRGQGVGGAGGLKATVVGGAGGLGAQALRLLSCRWAT